MWLCLTVCMCRRARVCTCVCVFVCACVFMRVILCYPPCRPARWSWISRADQHFHGPRSKPISTLYASSAVGNENSEQRWHDATPWLLLLIVSLMPNLFSFLPMFCMTATGNGQIMTRRSFLFCLNVLGCRATRTPRSNFGRDHRPRQVEWWHKAES